MGHTVDIHKSSYRLRTAVVEITKVGRLLMALDSHDISSYHGKKISSLLTDGTCSSVLFICHIKDCNDVMYAM